ncbi:MAG: alanine racemase [Blastocatellia bacterium]|nr:alanine racemase [Blastocatellia bacterium]
MKTTRRSIFKAALALPAIGSDLLASETARHSNSSFDPWVEIHAANLRHNVNEIRRRVASKPILAVIKNNGYGAGVAGVARILEPLPAIAGFAVIKLNEALALRDAAIKKPVLLMGPFDERDLAEAVARDVSLMVYTPAGEVFDRVSRRLQKPVSMHVCVDTGIGRVGVPHTQAASLIRNLASHKSIRIQGTMMTFTEDAEFDREQLARFQTLSSTLEKEGIRLGRKHAASSFALFQHEDAFLDMVRPGMAVFGIYSEKEFRSAGILELRPSLALRARVIYVKQLRRGESAGYNCAYVAEKDVWVATLPVGHADGLPRVAAKGARVRIGGRMYPIIASVSASHSIIEIGPEPRVRLCDVATVFDWQEGSRPEDVAAACGASVYDLTMHLNALLPRKVV